MEFIYFVNLIFLFVVNILLFFSGMCLNSLVIVSFWRSVQLRKKLCYFMIMVLSCCDLLAVLTNHLFTAFVTMLWLFKEINVYPDWLVILFVVSSKFISYSLFALFVMNVDQYLATHYPIFHRTSVTKGKLFTLFIFLVIFEITVTAMSTNNLVIPYEVSVLIVGFMIVPPMLLINWKLFTVARKSRRKNATAPLMKECNSNLNKISLKNISSCLLTAACLMLLSIPCLVSLVLRLTSKEQPYTLNNAQLGLLWAKTVASMNSTFNCLIFCWKNKTLRSEGMKVVESMKICGRGQACSVQTGHVDNNRT